MINEKLLLGNALAFFKIAERCSIKNAMYNVEDTNLIFPGIVNIGFSLELFLKYILNKEGNVIKKHNLLELFSGIKTATQEKIKKEVGYLDDMFINNLKLHAEIFEEYRYMYENDPQGIINYDFLYKLAGAIKKIIPDL